MLILGIDPGYERVGFGVIRREGSRLSLVEHGLIETPRIALPDRLLLIDEQLRALVRRVQPDTAVVEKLLFAANRKTAMDVSKAIGVILVALAKEGLQPAEYSPAEVKQAVVGYGNADKRQVQFMVAKLLGLAEAPKPDDVADALAIALAHGLRAGFAGTKAPFTSPPLQGGES